jgi:hypothetical protein
MKDVTIDAEFTTALRDFLERRGYTHIMSLGIDPKEINDASEPETPGENYWLEPIKSGDVSSGSMNDDKLLSINDTEIFRMVAGQDGIQYMMKVPLVDYNDYLAKR